MSPTGIRASILACCPWPAACSPPPDESERPPPQRPAAGSGELPQAGSLWFVEVASEAGLGGFRQVNGSVEKQYIVESVGAGLALIDHDRDGDLDVYLTNGSSLEGFPAGQEPSDALYENDGRGSFRDVTRGSGLGHRGWSQGARVVDFDADGWPDLYVTCFGPNVLYRNRGDGTFEDVTTRAGVGDPAWSTGASFLDFDRDGDLDLYVCNYVDFDHREVQAKGLVERWGGISVLYGPRGLPEAGDRLYRNRGDGTFEDASGETGIASQARFSFQAAVFDFDRDGWLDVYVSVDSQANLLWRNLGGTAFEDVALQHGAALGMNGEPQAGMGIAVGDYDGDLAVDLYVTNFSEDYSTLYRGASQGSFRDVSTRLDMREPTLPVVGWGCGFEDFDSDGDLDLYAVNGHVYPQVDLVDLGTSYRQAPQLFENLGSGRFARPEGRGGPGFSIPLVGRGSAVGDLDGDGDLDLLIGNLDGVPALLRNESAQGSWVKVLLIGGGMNRDAIGARLVARCGDRAALRPVGCSAGFLSSNDPREHFGLGSASRMDELEVQWPDGSLDRFEDLDAGTVVTIEQGRGIASVGLVAPAAGQ